MSILIVVIHIVVCIALIMIVLLQTGKGADMGAAFGGGASQTLFGATGASTFLSKATTAAAIIFMLTSLTLAYMSSNRGESRLVKEAPAAPEKTATETAPAERQNAAPSATDTQPATQESAPANTTGSQPGAPSGAPAEPAAPKTE
jgi:preprotein translocase subunit SecG